jgi:beta-N-acetylhexosaminidase
VRPAAPGFKFIIAVPICQTADETWRIIDGYLELEPGGFMVGVGGRLPILSPPGRADLVDYDAFARFIEELKRRYTPGFVAVDAEGGAIFNVLEGISPLSAARAYAGFSADPQLHSRLEADLEEHCELLAGAGVDMNFAPLLDVPRPGYRGYAAGDRRCVSDDPQEVTDFGRVFIRAHRRRGIICTAKHFPGYGHLTENPHRVLSDEAEAWDADIALAPYRALAAEGALQAVMLGHSTTQYHPAVPATLAPEALQLLRGGAPEGEAEGAGSGGLSYDGLGFDGLAVADELFMGAVNQYYRGRRSGRTDGDPQGRQRAMDAWSLCDLIIVSYPIQNRDGTVSGVPGGERRLPAMVEAVRRGLAEGLIPGQAAADSARRLSAAGLL